MKRFNLSWIVNNTAPIIKDAVALRRMFLNTPIENNLLAYRKRRVRTINSDIRVATPAPIRLYLGISNRFRERFIAAPAVTLYI